MLPLKQVNNRYLCYDLKRELYCINRPVKTRRTYRLVFLWREAVSAICMSHSSLSCSSRFKLALVLYQSLPVCLGCVKRSVSWCGRDHFENRSAPPASWCTSNRIVIDLIRVQISPLTLSDPCKCRDSTNFDGVWRPRHQHGEHAKTHPFAGKILQFYGKEPEKRVSPSRRIPLKQIMTVNVHETCHTCPHSGFDRFLSQCLCHHKKRCVPYVQFGPLLAFFFVNARLTVFEFNFN